MSRCGDMAIRNYPRWRHSIRLPWKLYPRTNMKCIGSPVAEILPFAYIGGIWNPILRKGRS